MAVRTIPVGAHEALHEYTRHLQPPLNIIMMLMSEAGMRVGEVTRLLWGSLVIQNQVVSALYIPSTVAKGGHTRTVGVNNRLSAAIAITWTNWGTYACMRTTDYVSATKAKQKAMSPRTVQRATHKLGERLGVANLNPHMLRHTFATRLMRVTDMRTVQEALGHRRLNTTQVYTHPTIDNITTAVEKI